MTTEQIAGLADWARVFDALGVPLAERAGIETQIEMLSHAWFKADTIRSLVTELLALREVLDLIREEVAKHNAPYGRPDSLALNQVRAALSMLPARALSHPEPMK